MRPNQQPRFIVPQPAFDWLMGPNPPVLIDVRRPEVVAESAILLPQTSLLVDQSDAGAILARWSAERSVLIACAFAHNRSQALAGLLRAEGRSVSIIEGGVEAWREAGLPVVPRTSLGLAQPIRLGESPTLWVTRASPKIDRVACPWLIRRFLDPNARILFAEPDWVLEIAAQLGGIAFDTPGAPLEHEGPLCTFDTLLRAFGLDENRTLAELAAIVRGADTGRHDLHPAAAGLHAVSLGMARRTDGDDEAVLRDGFLVYDALYEWARHARSEIHHWPRPDASAPERSAA